ncbi:MAG: NADAR family protein, partial [Saprospiraceae bacterium]
GITYNRCEKYIINKKAKLILDEEKAKKILEETDPSNQQKMGREIKNFTPTIWDEHKIGIVWYGNFLKFKQHKDLEKRLLATGSKILAEASPYDLIWGIGFRATDEEALDEKNWRGMNLLGKVLMSVRAALRI